jgi:hypothetical protein
VSLLNSLGAPVRVALSEQVAYMCADGINDVDSSRAISGAAKEFESRTGVAAVAWRRACASAGNRPIKRRHPAHRVRRRDGRRLPHRAPPPGASANSAPSAAPHARGAVPPRRQPEARGNPGKPPRRRHHARRSRWPPTLTGSTRMKCPGSPSTHGSRPRPAAGARSASVSR